MKMGHSFLYFITLVELKPRWRFVEAVTLIHTALSRSCVVKSNENCHFGKFGCFGDFSFKLMLIRVCKGGLLHLKPKTGGFRREAIASYCKLWFAQSEISHGRRF